MAVTIKGTEYPSYAELAETDEYWAGGFGDVADAWNLSVDTGGTTEEDRRSAAISQAYRDLNNAPWTSGAMEDTEWQDAAITANMIFAGILLEGSWSQSVAQSSSTAKVLKAGSAMIEFAGAFRASTKTVSQPTLPPEIKLLMSKWLQTAAGAGALAFASGTCHPNELDGDYRMIP